MKKLTIRAATLEDAKALLAIYKPYVLETAITFEYDVPSVEEFEARIKKVMEKYPYLVAEINGVIVGYAYASAFKDRAAYDWCVETSIYLRKDVRGNGIGRKLYEVLEEKLKEQGILNANACITYVEVEDEHMTNASTRFHENMGYRLVGRFHQCGYKFGKWYDMIWMEKMLGEHTKNPKMVRLGR